MSLTSDHAVESAAPSAGESTEIAGRSLTEIAWGRLRRDKVAMCSIIFLIIILMIAILAPLIAKLWGVTPDGFNSKAIDNAGGLPLGTAGGISIHHPLGVEPGTGRDLFARLLYGSRISLLIALSATAITVALGVTVGIIAGYSRGWLDTALGRLMDLILAFPLILILLALSNILTQRLQTTFHLGDVVARVSYLILVLSFFGWPYLARIVRGQVLSLREREFVESAVSMGAGTPRILFREILPNLWAPILVYSTLLLPTFIAAEATLSFLGVGLVPPTPSWGAMLADSVRYFRVDPAYLFIPGTYLFFVVLAFNLLGDSVRDALDPRAGRG
jgi:ABC-type dipeptide/oligopeptide/nickel transport system permease subunit